MYQIENIYRNDCLISWPACFHVSVCRRLMTAAAADLAAGSHKL